MRRDRDTAWIAQTFLQLVLEERRRRCGGAGTPCRVASEAGAPGCDRFQMTTGEVQGGAPGRLPGSHGDGPRRFRAEVAHAREGG